MTKPIVPSNFTRRSVVLGLTAAAVAAPAIAQQRFPTRTITILVPFPAGGTTDMLARLFGQRISQALGQPVIVENRGGAGGSIGADAVARATPDGYTLLFHNLTFSTTTVAMQLANTARHDIFRDFAPVALAASVPMVVLAPASFPADDLRGFVDHARRASTPLNYGSTGPGSIMNFAIEVLKRDAALAIQHVPYRGAAPLVQALLGGELQLGGDQLSTSLELIRSGRLKALATLSPDPISLLPSVPTVRQQGFRNMEMSGWNGFFAPAQTPAPIIAQIHAAVAAAARDAEVIGRLAQVGAEPSGADGAGLTAVVREQVDHIRPLVNDLRLTVG